MLSLKRVAQSMHALIETDTERERRYKATYRNSYRTVHSPSGERELPSIPPRQNGQRPAMHVAKSDAHNAVWSG